MTESLTKAQIVDLTKKMIKAGMKNTSDFRDEMYFQVIKQLRNNTHTDSQYAGWAILASFACFFSPSASSVHPLLNYLKFIAQNHPDDEVQVWARYSFTRIVNSFLVGEPRSVLPSNFELEYIRDHRKIPFTISFSTGGSIEIFIENYQTIGDLKDITMDKLGLDKSKKACYGFLEQTTRPDRIDECYVEDFVVVCNIVASWEHESYFYKKVQGGSHYNAIFKLIFKMKHNIPHEDENVAMNMMYNESCYLFNNLHFNSSYDDLIQLTALDLQIKSGDWHEDKQTYIINNYFDKIPNFVCKFKPKIREAQVIADLSEKYKALSGKKRNEAKEEFTEGVKIYDKFGYIFFVVKLQETQNCSHDYPERMMVGLRDDGMSFFDTDYQFVRKLEYGDIFKWGYSETTLVLLYGSEECPSKIVLRTFQGTALVHTLCSVVNLKLGKNPKPNTYMQSNMRQTNRETVFFKRVSTYRQCQRE